MTKSFKSTVSLEVLRTHIENYKLELSTNSTGDIEYEKAAIELINNMEKMADAAVEKLDGHVVEYPSLSKFNLPNVKSLFEFKKLYVRANNPNFKGNINNSYHCNNALSALSVLVSHEVNSNQKNCLEN